jgi:hypothetical protein
VVGVSGGHTADWCYSIGLWHTLRSPEVSVFGLGMDVAPNLLNAVGDGVRDGGPLRPGRRSDVLRSYDIELRPVHPSWDLTFFGAAVDFYRIPPLPILQLCWPDRAGRFAWESDFTRDFQSLQPMLWLPRDDHPPGPWVDEGPYAV